MYAKDSATNKENYETKGKQIYKISRLWTTVKSKKIKRLNIRLEITDRG